ncbi:hypothetical protein J5N97_020008 [Dioscorea zingiberensis]|uniref:RING-type domain-containing protein n=1 Tax=Dioscorea zingiberensis TaxID=325984 RepID=A0A9D5HD09_9LILI|nr:hypothetical protein J5N97_020008 [Dioscorea zingiberensis]
MKGISLVLFVFYLVCFLFGFSAGDVVLIGTNFSLSFADVEADFAPPIGGSGECGVLYVAEPLDACTPLMNKVTNYSSSPFALIIRGGCAFDEKVRNAQTAGFKAAIIYDKEDDDDLVSMAGTPEGIDIPAVFVFKASGEELQKYADDADIECWILPTDDSEWSMVISIMMLVVIFVVLATCLIFRRHWMGRRDQSSVCVTQIRGMSQQRVQAMPILIFTSASEDSCTSSTCAICLEDYKVGERLRVLPCHHKFHAGCVDSWLTAWRSFCPVCKLDARTRGTSPPASETTPLLSSPISPPLSSSTLSSLHSSIIGSPPIHRVPHPTPPSLSGSHQTNSHQSFNSPLSWWKLYRPRQASSRISHNSHLVPPHSIGFPTFPNASPS